MMNQEKWKKLILLLLKIFFIGLLVQFFLQTFVTFQLERDGGIRTFIWMWKEVFLLFFFVIILYTLIKDPKKWMVKRELPKYEQRLAEKKAKEEMERLGGAVEKREETGGKNVRKKWIIRWKSLPISGFISMFIITALICFVLAVVVQHVGIGTYIISMKYDLLGFFIFIIGFLLAWLFFSEKDIDIIKFYEKILIWVIILGLCWWVLVWLMPNGLKFFGYDPFTYEGTVGAKPPAAYYTMISKGRVRNQFLFERPISLGFYLIGFWPFFALGYARKKKLAEQITWAALFGLLVFSTLSRAAIGVRLVESALLVCILYWSWVKKYALLLVTGGLICIVGLFYFLKDGGGREHSNTGHIVLVQEGWNLAKDKLIQGRGAGYSGPASHQLCYEAENNMRCDQIREINERHQIKTYGYNPENQYLQILMEYGILGTLGWIVMLGRMLRTSLSVGRELKSKKLTKSMKILNYMIIGIGIGLAGLAIEGLVLHSFVDRMVIYPLMMLFGIAYGIYRKEVK